MVTITSVKEDDTINPLIRGEDALILIDREDQTIAREWKGLKVTPAAPLKYFSDGQVPSTSQLPLRYFMDLKDVMTLQPDVKSESNSEMSTALESIILRLQVCEAKNAECHQRLTQERVERVAEFHRLESETVGLKTNIAEFTVELKTQLAAFLASYEQLLVSHKQLESSHNELENSHNLLSETGIKCKLQVQGDQLQALLESERRSQAQALESERAVRTRDLQELTTTLTASHTELVKGHEMHAENCSQLQAQLEVHRQTQQTLLEAVREEHAQELKNHGELFSTQINERIEREGVERNAQVDHVIQRLNSSTVKLDQLLASNDVREQAFVLEREAKEEQHASELGDIRNTVQILKNQVAEERETWGRKYDEIASQLAILQQQSSVGIPANVLGKLNNLCEAVKKENAKEVCKLQTSIQDIQDSLEADRSSFVQSLEEERVAFRKSHEEHMRCVQSERDARLRQITDIRADYGKAIQKEHQDRVADAADQRKELLSVLRSSPATLPGTLPGTLDTEGKRPSFSNMSNRIMSLNALSLSNSGKARSNSSASSTIADSPKRFTPLNHVIGSNTVEVEEQS